MLAFVALSLVPSVLLFVIAGGLLTRSFDRWFDAKVESALQGSLEIGQTYYQNSANNAIFYARQLSRAITEEGLSTQKRSAELKAFVQIKQREYNLGTVEIFSPRSAVRRRVQRPGADRRERSRRSPSFSPGRCAASKSPARRPSATPT